MAENETETVPKPPKKKKLWILILALVVLVAGDLGFRAYSYFSGSPSDAETQEAAGPEEGTATEESEQSDAAPSKPKRPDVKSTMNLEPFLVNLADQEDVRFVKATFQLGLAEDKLGDELAKNPVVLATTRDTIITLLSSKTSDQVLTPEGKDQLRREIQSQINDILPKGQVLDVYIVDFVVQL